MNDFIVFRRMITPAIIIIIWAVATVAVVVVSLALIFGDNELGAGVGLLVLVFGPIVVRIYAEILMVVFRINETLTEIRNSVRARP